MPFVIAEDPGPIAMWIAKWIFLPFILVGVIIGGVGLTLQRRHCVALCVAAGFTYDSFTPGRYSGVLQPICTCSNHGMPKTLSGK